MLTLTLNILKSGGDKKKILKSQGIIPKGRTGNTHLFSFNKKFTFFLKTKQVYKLALSREPWEKVYVHGDTGVYL